MSSIRNLKVLVSRSEFARIIGFKPKSLSYILYEMPEESKYKSFEIFKKNGGLRVIQAPIPNLKKVQKRTANLLYNCCDEIETKYKKNLSHGFKKKYSIYTNAKIHKHKRYVLNFDIKDFFLSINFGRVRGFFIKNKEFALDKSVATVIAQIACHKNQLPQGSPCSPIISNLIAHLLDVKLVQLAKKYKLNYSRYADDITFSTNQKIFPKEIAFQDSQNPKVWNIGAIVEKRVFQSGFEINHKKTRMKYKDYRQVVTGLVVNKKLNVRSEYYKLARAMAHHLFTKGSYNIPSDISPIDILDKKSSSEKEITDLQKLEGILNHIYYTKNWLDIKQKESIEKSEKTKHKKIKEIEERIKNTAICKLLQKFLIFKNFIVTDKPVILCEGPTDSIYIKLALKKLFQKYPSLIKKDSKGKSSYYIRFFDRSKKNNKEILQFSGGESSSEGTGQLKEFLNKYQSNFENYPFCKKEEPKKPVILIVDNDKGSEGIFKTINIKYKRDIKIESDDDFFHICKNLYLIKTPCINKKQETCIEDLFDEKWLKNMKYDGKTFKHIKKNDKSDRNKYYGKKILATRVIPKNFSSVDFTGFQPLLDRLVKAIEDYKKS